MFLSLGSAIFVVFAKKKFRFRPYNIVILFFWSLLSTSVTKKSTWQTAVQLALSR